jgi:hypothetical protein
MKNLKRLYSVSLVTVLMVIATTSFAQTGGEWSLGPRFGGSSGISLKKHNGSNKGAFELLAGWNFDKEVEGINLNILYEKLAPLSGERLNAIFGAGAGLAVFGDEFRMGLAGIAGFDYRISKFVNLQIDWQPTWYFINGNEFSPLNAGFTVRYVLNNKKLRGKK